MLPWQPKLHKITNFYQIIKNIICTFTLFAHSGIYQARIDLLWSIYMKPSWNGLLCSNDKLDNHVVIQWYPWQLSESISDLAIWKMSVSQQLTNIQLCLKYVFLYLRVWKIQIWYLESDIMLPWQPNLHKITNLYNIFKKHHLYFYTVCPYWDISSHNRLLWAVYMQTSCNGLLWSNQEAWQSCFYSVASMATSRIHTRFSSWKVVHNAARKEDTTLFKTCFPMLEGMENSIMILTKWYLVPMVTKFACQHQFSLKLFTSSTFVSALAGPNETGCCGQN